MGVLSEGLTQVLILVASLVGIAFALFQWFLVSKVRVSGESGNGYSDRLIEEEEEGVDNFDVSLKCAEIQNAISVGELCLPLCICILVFVCFLGLFPNQMTGL